MSSVEYAESAAAMAALTRTSFPAAGLLSSRRYLCLVRLFAVLCLGSVAPATHGVQTTEVRGERLIAATTPGEAPAPAERPASARESNVPNERTRGLKFFAALGLIAVILLAMGTAVALLRSLRKRF